MKTNRIFLVFSLLAGSIAALALTGCKSSATGASSEPVFSSTAPPTSNTSTQKVEFLFVQSAQDVSFENGQITLHGVNPLTVCFADRPERIAGHMATAKMLPMWNEGKNSFTKDPPNATLSVLNGGKESEVVMELRNPRITGQDLTYDVKLLQGTPPAQGGPCSLFIDVIGMPLTPYSYAGAERRAARRGYVYPGAYGPTVVAAPAPVVVEPAPAVVY